MPVVVIPDAFLTPGQYVTSVTEVPLAGRTVREVVEELFARYPALATRYQQSDGRPSTTWFGLYRDEDEFDLRGKPEAPLGECDRLHLVNLIGC